jgi:hypothetical protein
LDDAMAWIAFYQRLWERRLDGLEAYFTLRSGATGPVASDHPNGGPDQPAPPKGTNE